MTSAATKIGEPNALGGERFLTYMIHDLPSDIFRRNQRCSDCSDVRIVPSVIVHDYRYGPLLIVYSHVLVPHCSHLVPIVPPAHNLISDFEFRVQG